MIIFMHNFYRIGGYVVSLRLLHDCSCFSYVENTVKIPFIKNKQYHNYLGR